MEQSPNASPTRLVDAFWLDWSDNGSVVSGKYLCDCHNFRYLTYVLISRVEVIGTGRGIQDRGLCSKNPVIEGQTSSNYSATARFGKCMDQMNWG